MYVTEKIGTKQGWSHPAPDEAWQHGYPQEFQDFMESIYYDREPRSGIELAADTIAAVYAGYLSAERGGAEVEVLSHKRRARLEGSSRARPNELCLSSVPVGRRAHREHSACCVPERLQESADDAG